MDKSVAITTRELEEWIDPWNIASAVMEAASEFGVVTPNDAHQIYSDFLENELWDGLRRSAKAHYSKVSHKTILKRL